MMPPPPAYEFTGVEVGEELPEERFPFLHDFFKEEGMALHLRSDAHGSELYTNVDGDLCAEILAHGICGASIPDGGAPDGYLPLVVYAGDPGQTLSLPFSYALYQRSDCEELLALSRAGKLVLHILAGTSGRLVFRGSVQGELPQEPRGGHDP